jgi:hypothetical protein
VIAKSLELCFDFDFDFEHEDNDGDNCCFRDKLSFIKVSLCCASFGSDSVLPVHQFFSSGIVPT